MSISGLLTGGLTSILSGGTLGVIGAIGAGVLDLMKTKEANKQELAKMAAQKELIVAAGSSAAAIESIKLAGASYEQDKAAYSGEVGFVDMVRGLLRPIVTVYLLAVSTYLALWSFGKVGLDLAIVGEICKYTIYTCLDLTSLCVSWYFGARQIDKINRANPPAKKK